MVTFRREPFCNPTWTLTQLASWHRVRVYRDFQRSLIDRPTPCGGDLARVSLMALSSCEAEKHPST